MGESALAPSPPLSSSIALNGGYAALCSIYDATKLRSPRSFQRLRRIDIQKRALAVDRDFGDSLSVLDDQMAGADVAVERHQFLEETARPQHGIAATAIADGDGDQMTAVRRKIFDQLVDQLCRDQRHV